MAKIHLGSGRIRIPEWVNIDCDENVEPDILDDVRVLTKIPNGSAEAIYACHVLEHFSHSLTKGILRTWHEKLAPGGELRISVPDMDRIVEQYWSNWKHFQTSPNTPWIGLIYGGQETAYDYHKTCFNFQYLSDLMESVGFEDVTTYPHSPHWLGIVDASLANQPFGRYLSLNIRGTKNG